MQRRRYWLTLVSGTLECLCFAGVVFGFASLVFVLKEERYFSQLCSGVPGSNGSQGGTGEPGRGSQVDLCAGPLRVNVSATGLPSPSSLSPSLPSQTAAGRTSASPWSSPSPPSSTTSCVCPTASCSIASAPGSPGSWPCEFSCPTSQNRKG